MSDVLITARGRSNTPTQLRCWRTLTVGATVLAGLFLAGVVHGAHGTTSAIADHTAPATAARVAQASLAEANQAVVESFRAGTATLAGPGQRYQDGITRANHSLARLAEYHVGDLAATQQLQFVNAMLVTYMGLVAQADTSHRVATATGADYDLGLVYLWQASKLLHNPEGGILTLIEALAAPVDQELARQADAWALRTSTLAAGLVTAALLLGILLGAQLFLFRRFRRVVNPPLVLATLCLLVLTGWTTLAMLDAGRDYRSVLTGHAELAGGWSYLAEAAGAQTHADLAELLAGPCARDPSCQDAVATALDLATPTGEPAPDRGPDAPAAVPSTSASQVRFNTALANATIPAGLRVGAPLLAVTVGAGSLLGFKPRLDEFRIAP